MVHAHVAAVEESRTRLPLLKAGSLTSGICGVVQACCGCLLLQWLGWTQIHQDYGQSCMCFRGSTILNASRYGKFNDLKISILLIFLVEICAVAVLENEYTEVAFVSTLAWHDKTCQSSSPSLSLLTKPWRALSTYLCSLPPPSRPQFQSSPSCLSRNSDFPLLNWSAGEKPSSLHV